MLSASESEERTPARQVLDKVTIRMAGDSGDGIQLTGGQFTSATALAGNDLATFPDFPAEIRAPAGTLPGVSGFQIQFSSVEIQTPGDQPDVLVAFNPAALKVNLRDLPAGGILIVNADEFDDRSLKKAGYQQNPLTDGTVDRYRVYRVPLTSLTLKALEESRLGHKEKERAKNLYALGILFYLYNRPMDAVLAQLERKFATKADILDANVRALKAGYNFADTAELFQGYAIEVPPAQLAPGKYRNISGNTAISLGLIAAAKKSGLPLFFAGYPITPASDILHELAMHRSFGVMTLQAEDEIAAVTAAVGASFAGSLAATASSGPGVALKTEGVNLAVMAELPLVLLDIQRGGPSTGLPTKTEQADLLMVLFGRNSESPVGVVAAQSPGDCFHAAFEACSMALRYMCPVYCLSDGYLANGAEPWRIPSVDDLPDIPVRFRKDAEGFLPYLRDERTLARPWAKPGTPGLEHRIGGIEKSHLHGHVSYDPQNHDFMVRLRAEKIARMAQDLPPLEVHGPEDARLLVMGWGGTYGHIVAAVSECQRRGMKVARAHLRWLNPFPRNLAEVLARFPRILVPELNLGQLRLLLRGHFLANAVGLNKVAGQPFKIAEIIAAIEQELKGLEQ